jgi:bifunctional isochorismate lyase / aryl carrier protein
MTDQSTPTHVGDLESLRSDVAGILETAPAEIGDEDNLVDHGLDSVRLLALVNRWQGAGAQVSFLDLAEEPSLSAWSRLLSAQAGTAGPDGTA